MNVQRAKLIAMSGPVDRISTRAQSFTESVIREMTRVANAHGAVNLAQGFPDFACPTELKEAAKDAIDRDVNQYAVTWGTPGFREAIAAKVARTYAGWSVDPDTQLCVTCGATEAMIATCLAIVEPGDEIVVFEPITGAIRKVHDFLTVGAAAPLQEAGIAAMNLPVAYYEGLAGHYLERREVLCTALTAAGFGVNVPDGAYYVLCDTSAHDPRADDQAFAIRLVKEIGLAGVAGSSFYRPDAPGKGGGKIRFAFPKKLDTLHAAAERLARLG